MKLGEAAGILGQHLGGPRSFCPFPHGFQGDGEKVFIANEIGQQIGDAHAARRSARLEQVRRLRIDFDFDLGVHWRSILKLG
jgi:hypothetical protein